MNDRPAPIDADRKDRADFLQGCDPTLDFVLAAFLCHRRIQPEKCQLKDLFGVPSSESIDGVFR